LKITALAVHANSWPKTTPEKANSRRKERKRATDLFEDEECPHGHRHMLHPLLPSLKSSPPQSPSTKSQSPLQGSIADHQEVKLHNGTPAQRRVWDDLATIYSIIVSLEYVEKAYVRDTITQAQYSLFEIRKLTRGGLDIRRNVPIC